MRYSFRISGHENVLSEHRSTIEFTKDSHLTLRGDCIVGVNASFELARLEKFLGLEKVGIEISAGGRQDSVVAVPNRKFCSDREMVVRMGDFDSERTFAVRASKAARDLNRDLVGALRKGSCGTVTVFSMQTI